ncbi:MAG TPA: hypothetical protein VGD17_09405 [Chitinophagaceae bacterium]
MLPSILQERSIVPESRRVLPDITIILPFEPKISPKGEIDKRIEHMEFRVASELSRNFSREEAFPMLSRLRKIINTLNYSTYKKSVAIFLSPVAEKVCYMNIDVNEQIIVGEPFNMLQLIKDKKETQNCMLLVLSAGMMKIFEANAIRLNRVMLKISENAETYKNDIPGRVANFSDPSERKEVMLDKFLHHADQALHTMLNSIPLPVFVMATDKTAGHFRKITSNSKHIVDYIHGNFDDATEYVLLEALRPQIAVWEKVKQSHLLNRIDTAMSAGRLSTGIRAVRKDAAANKGQLLVVEKNYTYPVRVMPGNGETLPYFITDAIDTIIANVLESGGDVELVDEGVLEHYKRIALVKYY